MLLHAYIYILFYPFAIFVYHWSVICRKHEIVSFFNLFYRQKKNNLKLHTVDVMLIAQIEKFIITINLPFTGGKKKKKRKIL